MPSIVMPSRRPSVMDAPARFALTILRPARLTSCTFQPERLESSKVAPAMLTLWNEQPARFTLPMVEPDMFTSSYFEPEMSVSCTSRHSLTRCSFIGSLLSVGLRSPRLGVADHALDLGKARPQAALDVVDQLVHLADPDRRVEVAVEVDDLAVLGFAHAYVMDVTQAAAPGGELGQRRADL